MKIFNKKENRLQEKSEDGIEYSQEFHEDIKYTINHHVIYYDGSDSSIWNIGCWVLNCRYPTDIVSFNDRVEYIKKRATFNVEDHWIPDNPSPHCTSWHASETPIFKDHFEYGGRTFDIQKGQYVDIYNFKYFDEYLNPHWKTAMRILTELPKEFESDERDMI